MLKDCEPNELEKIIKKNPLTQEAVKEIMQNKVGKIKLTKHLIKSSVYYNKESGKYDIYFSEKEVKDENPEIPRISLIHRLEHIHCGISSVMHNETTIRKSMNMESIMDNASHIFYGKNKEFIDKLYQEIYSKYLKQKIEK